MKLKSILLSIWILIMVPTIVYGIFFDTVTSFNNSFSATTLETTITPELPPPVNLNISYEIPYPSTSFILTNIGQLTTRNTLSIVNISNPSFTSLINVEVILDDTTTIYTGPLNLLSASKYLVQTNGQSNKLGFLFSISESNYNDTAQQSTTFRIKNHAWQTTQPYGSGFFDNEYYEITITNPEEIVEEEVMGKVIVNEVMWSGTSISLDDQWIELRNTTSEAINIGQWKIYYLRDLNKPPIMIPASRVIPANGYFLISNYSNESHNSMLNVESNMSNASMNLLLTNNGNLVLKDEDGNTIDQVLGDWPAGIQGDTYRSMQRTSNGINGLLPSSWYTCDDDLCMSTLYWKIDTTFNYGSPGSTNIPN